MILQGNKDAKTDFNNTKDTAEFGDCDMQVSKESQEVCFDYLYLFRIMKRLL